MTLRNRIIKAATSEGRSPKDKVTEDRCGGNHIAVVAMLDMGDGLPGGIWIDEEPRTVQLPDADLALDTIELPPGSSVCKPMYLLGRDVQV